MNDTEWQKHFLVPDALSKTVLNLKKIFQHFILEEHIDVISENNFQDRDEL
jgi:beta-galactosidase GanA